MVLNDYRASADKVLVPIANRFKNWDPNTITYISMIFALAAGFLFLFDHLWAIGLASLMILINSVLDAVDGKVARMTGKTSKRGDFLDHLVDRYADLAILAGITLGPWCHDWVGVLAIAGVFMTSYTGTQAQALGLGRNYGGILGRADRLVLLILFPLVQILGSKMGFSGFNASGYWLSIIEIMMIWFAIAGNITALQRASKAWKDIWE